MKTRMNENSIKSFTENDFNTNRFEVYLFIKESEKPVNYIEVAKGLNMPIPTVVGRINDLLYDYQLIKPAIVKDNRNHYVCRSTNDKYNIREETNTVSRERVSRLYKSLISAGFDNQKITEIFENFGFIYS